MHCVYVLESLKDLRHYIGVTTDIGRRVEEHNEGKVPSTKSRRPLRLIYSEDFETRSLAEKREKYFKTGKGFETLKNLLRLPR